MSLKTKDKHLIRLVKRMCRYAKINYETLEFVGDWYSTNTWTEKQQNAFRAWFVDTLYKDNKFRKGLYACMPKNKKAIRDAWSWFNLAYGFRVRGVNNDV